MIVMMEGQFVIASGSRWWVMAGDNRVASSLDKVRYIQSKNEHQQSIDTEREN